MASMLDETKRQQLMGRFLANAVEAQRRGDVIAQQQAADAWNDCATASEARRAPKVLCWTGRWVRRDA